MAITNSDVKVDAYGKTKAKYFVAGYREAMADIARIIDENAGPNPWETASQRLNDIRDWIENNSGVKFTDDIPAVKEIEYDYLPDEVYGSRDDPMNCNHCGLVGGH